MKNALNRKYEAKISHLRNKSKNNIKHFKTHIKPVHNKIKLSQCDECNFNTNEMHVLNNHIKLVHQDSRKPLRQYDKNCHIKEAHLDDN